MIEATSATLAAYMDIFKWKHKVVNETTVITVMRSSIPFYEYTVPMHFVVGKHWMVVRGFLQKRVPSESRIAVLDLLSKLNAHAYEVRFSMADDAVVLSSEIPMERLTEESFLYTVRGVMRYANVYGLEISVMASNVSVSNLYLEVETLIGKSGSDLPETDVLDFGLDVTANRLMD